MKKIKYIEIKTLIIRIARKLKYIYLLSKKYGIKIVKAKIKEVIFPIIKSNKKPVVLQFPITYHCNFDCVMCGMNKLKDKKDISIEEIRDILSDDFFSEIRSVGINGGEPFLRRDISSIICVLKETLPKLQIISIITNGFFVDIIEKELPIIYNMCKERRIKLGISVSVDGVGKVQNDHRGNSKAWECSNKTLEFLKKNKEKCCDFFGVICTVSRKNVFNLYEIDSWAHDYNYSISYNIATFNKRIRNEEKLDKFSILLDIQAKMYLREFFWYVFLQTKDEKYFALYKYLNDGCRVAPCEFQKDGVTITPDGEMSYCATYSKELGRLINQSAKRIFQHSVKYRKQLCKRHCGKCSHYIYSLSSYGYIELVNMLFKDYTRPIKM